MRFAKSLLLVSWAFTFFCTISIAQEDALVISSEGNVGIHKSNPQHLLEFNLGAYTDGRLWFIPAASEVFADGAVELSDEDALTILKALSPKRLTYEGTGQEEQFGFVAGELPGQITDKDGDNYSPVGIVAVLTQVVKAQQQKIEELELALQRLLGSGEVKGANPPVMPVASSSARIPDGCTVYLHPENPNHIALKYSKPNTGDQIHYFARVYKIEKQNNSIVANSNYYSAPAFPQTHDSHTDAKLITPHVFWKEKEPAGLTAGYYYYLTNCFNLPRDGMFGYRPPGDFHAGCSYELSSQGSNPVFSFTITNGLHSPSINIFKVGSEPYAHWANVEQHVADLFAGGEKEFRDPGVYKIGLDDPDFWRVQKPAATELEGPARYFYFIDDCSNTEIIDGVMEID